jgi:hypothetical protein
MSVMIKPRPMMTVGKYYVPNPRRMSVPREPDFSVSNGVEKLKSPA